MADSSVQTIETDNQADAAPALRGFGVAVLIPCYNEAATIAKVVGDFRAALPEATIYVYDNNSTDDTASIAAAAGAIVHHESRQGKGNVVRSMFRDIDADYYLMVDGDDTYPAETAGCLLAPIIAGDADMTVGDRISNGTYGAENDRPFHGFGNNLVRRLIRILYGYSFEDVMTGYRAFSHAFVKTMPVMSEGFQIETEISVWAVDRRWRVVDVPIDYRDRPEGSESKLSTYPWRSSAGCPWSSSRSGSSLASRSSPSTSTRATSPSFPRRCSPSRSCCARRSRLPPAPSWIPWRVPTGAAGSSRSTA